MGDPRKQRKTYQRPFRPWNKTRIENELVVVGEYGLRNKKELWKHANQLRRFRQIARDLKTMPEERQKKGFAELSGKLNRLGLVSEGATTDDVLSLQVRNILDRRLQTIVYKRGLARSIYQARQFVVHKHISIAGKVISSPSYLVKADEEEEIDYQPFSPLKDHPEKVFGETKKTKNKKKKKKKKSSKSKSSKKKRKKSSKKK